MQSDTLMSEGMSKKVWLANPFLPGTIKPLQRRHWGAIEKIHEISDRCLRASFDRPLSGKAFLHLGQTPASKAASPNGVSNEADGRGRDRHDYKLSGKKYDTLLFRCG